MTEEEMLAMSQAELMDYIYSLKLQLHEAEHAKLSLERELCQYKLLYGELSETEPAPAEEKRTNKPENVVLNRIKGVLYSVMMLVAVLLLAATLIFPTLKVSGDSMEPTLHSEDVVLLAKTDNIKPGDLCAFNWQDKILLKRVIAQSGDVVEINESGVVTVNGIVLEETYIQNQSLGSCNITFPYTVPEGSYFVLGDNRSVSADSRNIHVGCALKEQVIGKVFIKIWPLSGRLWIR